MSCHRRNLTTGSSRSLAPRPECAMPPTAPTSTGWDSTLSFQGLPAQLGSAALLSGYQAPLTWSPSPHTSSIHPWNQWEGRNVFHYAFYYSRNQLLNFYWNLICCLQTLLFHSWSTNFYILLSKTIKSLSSAVYTVHEFNGHKDILSNGHALIKSNQFPISRQ